MRFVRGTALLIGMTLLASQAARATTLLLEPGDQAYTTLAAWEAAVTLIGTDTFDSLTAGTTYSTATGYVDPLGIDFVGGFEPSGYSLEAVGPSMSQYYNYGSGNSLASGPSSSANQPYIKATLPASVTAVALDVMTGSADSVTLTFSDGTTETVSTSGWPNQTFVSFTFSAQVTWVEVSIPNSPLGTSVLLDNFAIGTADVSDPVPEPAAMLLVGLGLVLMACLRKRGPA
jgi:hypothetical protein